MAEARSAHLPEIDWLKGFAILSVVCIHAKWDENALWFEHVVNRAVPIFLVLFGLTSELWMAGHDVPAHVGAEEARVTRARVRSSWYRGRLWRLLPPYWAMAAAWWLAAVPLHAVRNLRLGPVEFLATFAGYSPWIGTSWFVTLILQLVLLFPALRWAVGRVGPVVALSLSAALCVACVWYVWDIVAAGRWLLGDKVPPPGWYYSWIFAPRVLWHVVAGIYVARFWGGRPGPGVTAASLAVAAAGSLAIQWHLHSPAFDFVGPLRVQTIQYLIDVPLAVGLLGTLRGLARVRPLTAVLGWCGRWSWGLYLGHLLAHEVLHMGGIAPEGGSVQIRATYAVVLLVLGAAFALMAAGVKRAVVALARLVG